MSQCIAITKKGHQCKNSKTTSRYNLFCGTHVRTTPDIIYLETTDKYIPFTNEDDYIELIEQHNKENNDKDKAEAERLQRIEQELHALELAKYDSWNTCIVCGDQTATKNELIECSSSNPKHIHTVCKTCIQGHITSLLSDGIASLECMFNKHDKCGGEYNENIIKNTIDNDDMFQKWQDVMVSTEIIKLAGICENYIICPLCCKWGCIFEIPAGAEKHAFYITCASCKGQWCSLCKRKSHNNNSCYQLDFTADEKRNPKIMTNTIDKMIQDIATRALTHSCGICSCTYVKEEGCNLMTCPKCYGMTCYICGMKLYYKGDTKYWHFTGHDKSDRDARCPLWNNRAGDGKSNQGNTEYNLLSIEKEFSKLLDSNKDDRIIIKIILQRILETYNKDKQFNHIIENLFKTFGHLQI